MKKILFIGFFFISLNSFCQLVPANPNDTVKISLPVQARDLEFIASFLFENPSLEDLYDSVKVKFRNGVAPSGNEVVSITAKSAEWFTVYESLVQNVVAYNNNVKQRVEALLTTAGTTHTFIIDKLTSLSAYLETSYQQARQQGRRKLKRNNLN